MQVPPSPAARSIPPSRAIQIQYPHAVAYLPAVPPTEEASYGPGRYSLFRATSHRRRHRLLDLQSCQFHFSVFRFVSSTAPSEHPCQSPFRELQGTTFGRTICDCSSSAQRAPTSSPLRGTIYDRTIFALPRSVTDDKNHPHSSPFRSAPGPNPLVRPPSASRPTHALPCSVSLQVSGFRSRPLPSALGPELVPVLKQRSHGFSHGWQLLFHRSPNDCRIDAEIIVNGLIPHAGHSAPGNFRMRLPKLARHVPRRLADHLQRTDERPQGPTIRRQCLDVRDIVTKFDGGFSMLEDVAQIVDEFSGVLHTGIASAKTLWPIRCRNAAFMTKSTLRPR